MKPQLTSSNFHFPHLTGMRFLAAMAVLLFHSFGLGREIWGDFSQQMSFKMLAKLFNKGHLGVSFFFVLSGFLLTSILLRELNLKGKVDIKAFVLRRILRIWPLYFLVVLFGFFIFPHLPYGQETVHEFWRYAVFLSNIDEIIHGMNDSLTFLTATWSISIEEQFYLGWAIILAIFPFRKKKHFLFFFLLTIFATLIFRSLNYGDDRTMYFHTFSVISDFAIGGLLALIYTNEKFKCKLSELPKWKIIGLYVLGFAIFYLEYQLFQGVASIFQRIVIATFFAFFIAEQLLSKNSFFKVDSIPVLARLGEWTYGLYLFHCIWIYYLQAIFIANNWTSGIHHFAVYLLLVIVLSVSSSYLSYRYFESPFLKLKSRFRRF
ncbi:MAG: acyltransferase [Crocinitomicaceae bacterium]|nr:acyltransferase [Crocinitomicaceae bacterium]